MTYTELYEQSDYRTILKATQAVQENGEYHEDISLAANIRQIYIDAEAKQAEMQAEIDALKGLIEAANPFGAKG